MQVVHGVPLATRVSRAALALQCRCNTTASNHASGSSATSNQASGHSAPFCLSEYKHFDDANHAGTCICCLCCSTTRASDAGTSLLQKCTATIRIHFLFLRCRCLPLKLSADLSAKEARITSANLAVVSVGQSLGGIWQS